jgi:NitT/TauT family transport system ATP-binding protein
VSVVVDGRASTTVLRVAEVGKRYVVDGPTVLAGVTFDVTEGELVAIVGPSGCGKTTLLRIMSGLLPPSDGAVLLDGRPVVRPSPQISLVFQDYSRSLFPWLDVLRNVMFPLHRLGLSRAERAARAEAALNDVGLNGVGRSYPWQLSGGMQQRVAIARALVSRPEVVFLDEPFASVDALTRADLQDVLLGLQDRAAERRVSVVHVTHDVDEAVYLADRVLVLTPSPGTVAASIAVGLPRPRTQTVTRSSARFLAVRNEIHDAVARHRHPPEEDR